MGKIVKSTCIVITLCISLLIINIFRTQEINRINNMEDSPYIVHFYLTDQRQNSTEMMKYLSFLSKKYNVY